MNVPNGSISLQLNVDATIIAEPWGFVSAAESVTFQFNAKGELVQPCLIWSNFELEPQNENGLGTFYFVAFFDQNGARISGPLAWQFTQPNGSTVDIGEMTPYFSSGNIIYYPIPGGGVTSLNGGTGPLTLTSTGNTISITPSGSTIDLEVIGGGGGSPALSSITSGTNISATMTVGSGASLGASGSGIINATAIAGVTITGTPTAGQVPTATSGTAATWQTPPLPPSAPVGAYIWQPNFPPTTFTNGFQGYTLAWLLPAWFLNFPCNTWKFGISFATGTNGVVIGGMQVVKVATGTTTPILSVTPVTIGSSLTPTLTIVNGGCFQQFTDPIALPITAAYDYYFMLYFNTGTIIDLPQTAEMSAAQMAGVAYQTVIANSNELSTWAVTLPTGFTTSGSVDAAPIAIAIS